MNKGAGQSDEWEQCDLLSFFVHSLAPPHFWIRPKVFGKRSEIHYTRTDQQKEQGTCMNITLDTQFSTSGPGSTETTTTTYKAAPRSQGTGNVSRSGYTAGIADKVMDNEAYRGHGSTAADIMQQAANTDVSVQKDFMIVMSSCVSGEDLQKMQEEGFNPCSMDVETYVNIVDRIKITLAQAGVEVAGYNDDLDVEQIEKITGTRAGANELISELSQALQESDLPVTTENIAELVTAVMEASGISGLSDDAIKYLIENGKAPTIENIYKAQYSSTDSIRQSQGYYSDGAGSYGRYYAKKAEDINWENLEGRLTAVVAGVGLDTDPAARAQALEDAKWLVASGIELNEENLLRAAGLRSLELPMATKEIVDMCVTAMENGKAPMQADMTGETSIAQEAREICETVSSISDQAVHDVAASGKEMNIRNLSEAQQAIGEQEQGTADGYEIQAGEADGTDLPVDETALKEIQARRQLEEIRLMMTEEANRHLLKAGISIDTTGLSELVEALKAAEEKMQAVLFRGEGTEENAQRAQLYEETLTKTKELADMPAALLGKLLSRVHGSTLSKLHEQGRSFQEHDLSKGQQGRAAGSYETLMTAPRKDLGDKISKAFRNIDEILGDLGLETSEGNRRAVRILGYNRMEITRENIQAVKDADSQVTGVIRRMTPAATLQMIREQKNPLRMTMDELEGYLDKMDRDPLADAERYSRFLQRLDREHAISADEREAYIGIYRLFRQIEKSDGAVIGSIVATGAQMSFKNMLSAVRTAAGRDMDVRVDDGFGGLEELITKGKAIDAQIEAGYHEPMGDSESRREAERYYARLSGEIDDELASGTDLKDQRILQQTTAETTIEAFADNIKAARVPGDSEQAAQERAERTKDLRRDIQKAEQIDDQIVEMLIEYGQPVSIENVHAASMLIQERGSLFRQIISPDKRDQASQDDDADQPGAADGMDTEDAVLAQADRFIRSMEDAPRAQAAYQEIIREADRAVERMIDAGRASRIDVRAAQALYKGLSLAGNLAREEVYEVPMDIKGEITSVNLKICHDSEQAGKVAITLDTEQLGKVAAEFDVAPGRASGMVVYENRAQKTELEKLDQSLKEALLANGIGQADISLVHAKAVDLDRFGRRTAGVDRTDEKVSTVGLYQTAKAFLTALRDL